MLLGVSSAHLGQEDLENRPAPLRASYANRAAVFLHDGFGDPETQAIADRFLGREERLEDVAPMLGIDTPATIGNRYSQPGLLRIAPFAKGDHSQEKSSTAGTSIDSVRNQIGKYLPQLTRIRQRRIVLSTWRLSTSIEFS